MKIKKTVINIISHGLIGLVGFAAGIYTLPILTAPDAPSSSQIEAMGQNASFQAAFIKDLQDSDFLHQAEGEVMVSDEYITFIGSMSPGPDYVLYLSPEFVETEEAFLRLKNQMTAVGQVKTFDNFIVDVSDDVNVNDYNSVIIWCESFNQFITATKYQ